MAHLPVPSAKKLGKYKSCCRVFQILLKIFASSSLRFASLTLHDLVHQTADKKRLRTSTQELYFECVI